MKERLLMSESRILFLPDLHIPYNINLDSVCEFAQDFKPTTIIFGGDTHDFTSVCHWIADQSRALVGGTVMQNYKELISVGITPFFKAAPKAKFIYLTGNHEDWIRQAIERI